MNVLCRFAAACAIGALMATAIVAGVPTAAAAQASGSEQAQATQDQGFQHWLQDDLMERIKANKDYHRLPLDTDAQTQEFLGWLHALYRQHITPDEFEQRIGHTYPGHDAEARFIISCLPPPSAR